MYKFVDKLVTYLSFLLFAYRDSSKYTKAKRRKSMGHRIREWSPDQYYHVSSRGNRKEPLFLSGEDYSVFLHLLSKIHEKYPIELTSYCLMTNHYHLQIRSPEVSLSKVMALLNKRYAHYFNKKYDKTGHLFE